MRKLKIYTVCEICGHEKVPSSRRLCWSCREKVNEYATTAKKKQTTRGKKYCNGDCLHCVYDDCLAEINPEMYEKQIRQEKTQWVCYDVDPKYKDEVKHTMWRRAYYTGRIAQGCCPRCGKPNGNEKMIICPECRAKDKARRAKIKRGENNG